MMSCVWVWVWMWVGVCVWFGGGVGEGVRCEGWFGKDTHHRLTKYPPPYTHTHTTTTHTPLPLLPDPWTGARCAALQLV